MPFKHEKFVGLRFKEVCMILYYKLNMTLIGLEIKVGNQLKVFVNPAEYVFSENDHWGYVIYHSKPNYLTINAYRWNFLAIYFQINSPSISNLEVKL